LHDPAYFARQSEFINEDLKTVACISSPEHRILVHDVTDIPAFFVEAILASEDKNFFRHQGIDKAAILRALAGRVLGRVLNESRSGASTLAMQLERCTVLDAPFYVSLGRGRGVKKIENFHSHSEPEYRGEISCRIALGESRNAAAMRAGARARIKNVIALTYRLGMPKDARHMLQPYPTTAIGASEVNPLAMASAAAFVNGGFRVTPRFANDVCRDGKSLLYKDDAGLARGCDLKGESHPPQERLVHPAVSAAMTELLKAPVDIGSTGTAAALRSGVIPGMDPLGEAVWKLKPEERKKRTLVFPIERAGEIAAKTGTATNADGKTSDVWLLVFVPGTPKHPEKGVMLGFWMGKDSKDHPLGERGSTGGPGFAESGGRNWVHSAATVLAFLQNERGLLKPGDKFQPIIRDEALASFDGKKTTKSAQ
jgi:membrane peptidoglycan carboxypeptidase